MSRGRLTGTTSCRGNIAKRWAGSEGRARYKKNIARKRSSGGEGENGMVARPQSFRTVGFKVIPKSEYLQRLGEKSDIHMIDAEKRGRLKRCPKSHRLEGLDLPQRDGPLHQQKGEEKELVGWHRRQLGTAKIL